MGDQFYEFAVILAIAAGMGAIGRLLRQPLIVTFIAVGVCVGPAWLGIVTAGEQIELLARMGIAILLFLVGLRLDLDVIRTMGRVAHLLTVFERRLPFRELGSEAVDAKGADYIIFGLGRYGSSLARYLRQRGAHVLGMDFDPQVLSTWHKLGHAAQYGDAEDPELTPTLPLQRAQWVVCTVPRKQTNSTLLQSLREYGYIGRVALTAHHVRDADALRKAGADLVLMPFVDAAKEAADSLVGYRESGSEASAVVPGLRESL